MLISVLAVDSQLGQIGAEWPADTAAALLNRSHADLTEQVERVDVLVAEVEGHDGPDEAA